MTSKSSSAASVPRFYCPLCPDNLYDFGTSYFLNIHYNEVHKQAMAVPVPPAVVPPADAAVVPGADVEVVPGADAEVVPGADAAVVPVADAVVVPGADGVDAVV